tara:strand:- start:1787 stop:2101 length:315 start_codon:yes stop_codon:yes gene_type:complete
MPEYTELVREGERVTVPWSMWALGAILEGMARERGRMTTNEDGDEALDYDGLRVITMDYGEVIEHTFSDDHKFKGYEFTEDKEPVHLEIKSGDIFRSWREHKSW